MTRPDCMTPLKPQEKITLADRIGYDNVFRVVNDFYDLIQTHPTLAGPFGSVAHWDEHKFKIAQFWFVVLGGKPTAAFRYDPVAKHFAAGFTGELLHDWKTLFHSVLLRHLDPALAEAWFERVELIGENLQRQNERLVRDSLS